MIDLVFGLHLYQPPNQNPQILKKITEESYLPIIELILSHPCSFFSVDIARSAIENLEKENLGSCFLEKLKMAYGLGKISLINTAAYHPILPLLPKREIARQSLLNEESYRNIFRGVYKKPAGFFPPEMAFSQKLLSVFEGLGYGFTITADTPFACYHKKNPPFEWIPKQRDIAMFLRSDLWSKRVAFEPVSGKDFAWTLKKDLKGWFGEKEGYLIIWLDWETFGHHRPKFIETFLVPFLNNLGQEINLVSLLDLLAKYPQKEIIIPPGSWSTTAENFKRRNYWPLWRSPDNEFHQLWWELAKIVLEIKKGVVLEKTPTILDKALYSCQTWQWSQGNKGLAIEGMKYFREILKLEKSEPYREKTKGIIERLENLCR